MEDQNKTLHEYLYRVEHIETFLFEVQLVDHCNLNCKYCDHFAPFAKPWFYDIDQYTKDLYNLKRLCDNRINQIRLQGGEPLLHPCLLDFLRITRKIFPEISIFLITNGLLLKEQKESFWEALSYFKITLALSEYPNIDNSILFEKKKLYNFETELFGPKEIGMRKDVLDLSGSQNPRTSFLKCFAVNNWIPLRDGYIYVCPMSATILSFSKKFNINITEEDCKKKKLSEIKDLEELQEFLIHEIPLCRFCEKSIWNLPWEPSKRKVTEYLE